MLRVKRWIVFAMAILPLAAPLGAQTANGVIQGTVIDAQGGVLPGVTLTVRSVETGLLRIRRHRGRRAVPCRGTAAGPLRPVGGARRASRPPR